MKKRLIAFGIIFLVVINISALATLMYNRWFKAQRLDLAADSSESLAAIQNKMSLSTEQLERMRNLRSSYEADIDEIRWQMQEKRKVLVAEIKKAKPDIALINELIDEIGNLQSRVQKRTIRNLLKDKSILTPTQREKYFSMFEDYVHRRRVTGRRKGLRSLRKKEEKTGVKGKSD